MCKDMTMKIGEALALSECTAIGLFGDVVNYVMIPGNSMKAFFDEWLEADWSGHERCAAHNGKARRTEYKIPIQE